jgi:hypothetical protein
MTDDPPTDDEPTVESLTDPETLRGREDVEFVEEEFVLGREEYEEVRERMATWTSHAVVGIIDDDGATLLANDGSHGWTLPAFPVESGDDYATAVQDGVEELTGVAVEVDGVERARRVDYRFEDGEPVATLYQVVFRAAPVAREDVTVGADGGVGDPDVEWFDDVPETDVEEGSGAEADVRLFVD